LYNVIWTTGNGAPDYDPENPMFKDILTTFQNRTEDILQFGSLYPPANASLHLTFSFISGFYDKVSFLFLSFLFFFFFFFFFLFFFLFSSLNFSSRNKKKIKK